jgi:signal transduction histidine kinase/CheY-like chemotaxis protein
LGGRGLSVRTKLLVIVLPLIAVPMLMLGAVGFLTSSREAAKTSSRYLAQRETDLRALAENPGIPNYVINRAYGLLEEAEVARRELEQSFKRFLDRSNSAELIYRSIRYVGPDGDEVVKIVDGEIRRDWSRVDDAPFFASATRLRPGEAYLSAVGPTMMSALPVYHRAGPGPSPRFQGAVVVEFVYPVADFQRVTWVILRTFVIITALSLGIALCLTIIRVRRLTDPIRRLAEAANLIAEGQRAITVTPGSHDEIGRLATAFNDMAASLEANEAALRRKVVETSTLYEIGQEMTAQVALQPTLELIVERARDLLQADVSRLALREENGDRFVVQAHAGPATGAHLGLRFRAGEGVVGRVIATGQPIIVGDYRLEYPDSPFLEVIQEAGLRAYVAVPLKAHGSVIGVLYVISRAPHQFDAEDQQLLGAMADQASIAIENARLYEQAKRHAEELEAKVEIRTRELQEANRRLEEASRHKSEFLANMSHELRTPLNAIIGFTRLVMRRSKDALPSRQYENLEKILVSADHLLALINDILDLSKIEAGRMEVRPLSFDLAPLIDECLRTVEPMVRSDRLRLLKDVGDDLPPLFTDRDKLKQILMNLLSNAIKFTEVGTVTVAARRENGRIVVAVVDTGIGIPEDARDLIFEEFRQLDSSPTRKYGGTGLGLSISRHFARLLGGDITVESTLGVGSTFIVTIPIRHAGGTPMPHASAAPSPTEAGGPVNGARLVLAIDDDPNAIDLLRENLGDAGYRVIGALSGREGVERARQLRPFAITLDILMPDKDGWEVLRALKADAATAGIPIIVISVLDNKALGFRLGAFDYLLKPLDREAVLAALGRIRGQPSRLLVVDDDPQVVDLVRQMLEDEPYEVAGAPDGQEALDAVSRRRPDIILLDLLMPRMDGFAVIEHLQQDAQLRLIPIIVLTAKALTPAEQGVLEQSVLKVIQKQGLGREAFIHELRGALEAHRDAGPTP